MERDSVEAPDQGAGPRLPPSPSGSSLSGPTILGPGILGPWWTAAAALATSAAMYVLQIARWVLNRLVGTAVGWIWITTSLAALPLLRSLTPEGVLGHGEGARGLLPQAAFLASLTGMVLAMGSLARNDWLLERPGPGRRVSSQATGLLAAGLAGAALVLAGDRIPIATAHGGSLAPRDLLAMTLATLHLAALAASLLQLPTSIPALPLGLPLVGWILPALVPPGAPGVVNDLLNAHRPPQDWTLPRVLAALGPIVFWLGLALFGAAIRSSAARPLKR